MTLDNLQDNIFWVIIIVAFFGIGSLIGWENFGASLPAMVVFILFALAGKEQYLKYRGRRCKKCGKKLKSLNNCCVGNIDYCWDCGRLVSPPAKR